MYPVLFKIPLFGGITIYTYGFFVALAFLVAMFWVSRDCKRKGLNASKAMDLAFYIIVAALVGSRVLHVLVSERQRFLENPLILLKIWEGGLVFYGGFIASVAVAAWYMWRQKMNFWIYSDVFTPAIALGHVFGRIGCFMAGCCHGREVGHGAWYSVSFPDNPHSFAPPGHPLYPTQLMEASGELLIFIFLVILSRHKRFEGQLLATWLVVYAILRGFVEYFRGDIARGFLIEPWLSTSQFISILMFIAGIAIYIIRWKRMQERLI
jgi:phosphatidylglycerol:prolipoprotein diacylglycerol transferase